MGAGTRYFVDPTALIDVLGRVWSLDTAIRSRMAIAARKKFEFTQISFRQRLAATLASI
jgi:hypothetical protein